MAQVTVTIDGKAYRMACEEGQEDHLTDLAGRLDQYVAHLKSQFGEIGDLRLTVMAGIMIMDELAEVKRKLAEREAEIHQVRSTLAGETEHQQSSEMVLASTLSELAGRIESLTGKLSGRGAPVN
ncbi:MAG TPA: cell division protein ZapA [Pseudorhizobium sp.]|nr:cell division protein ZapA [Pseudorhizobium sp.]